MSKLDHKPASTPPAVGHETRDTNIKGVLIAGGLVALLLVGGLLVAHWTLKHYLAGWDREGPAPSPLKAERRPPQGPLLQASPQLDMDTLRQAEERRLTTYGRDPLTGQAHVPIDRAMELILERGLPVRKEAGPGVSPGPAEGSAPNTAPAP